MPRKFCEALDLLRRDILNDARIAKDAGIRAKAHGRVHVPTYESPYRDPRQWTPGRAIELRHSSGEVLGTFREYFHATVPETRRLLPAPAGTLPDTSELVWGDFWLHPRFQAPLPDFNEDEAIRARFIELVEGEDEE